MPFRTWVQTSEVSPKVHAGLPALWPAGPCWLLPARLLCPVRLRGAWPAPARDGLCPSAGVLWILETHPKGYGS